MLSEPVQPAFEIHLPPPPGNSWTPVVTSFDPASSKLLVQYSVPSTKPGNWWRYHAPDFAAPFLFILALIFVFSVRRILRRPQLFDHLYCRACNYDLTPHPLAADPPTSSEQAPALPSLCPECGTSTLTRKPVEGLPAFRRFAPLIGFAIPLLLVPVLILCSRLEPKNSGNIAWPLQSLDQIKWWPIARPLVPPHQSRHFETYALPAGVRTRHTFIEDDPWNGRLTRDLSHYTYSRFSEENGWDNQAAIFDPTTGRVRTRSMGGSDTGFSAFHGYTPDEKEAVYTLISLVGPENICTARIIAVDLETLKVREAAQVKVAPQSTGPNSWQLPTLSASVCNSPACWAFLIVSGPDAGLLHYGTQKSESPGETKLTRSPSAGPSPLTHLSYNDDGTLLIDESFAVNLQTGIVTARPLFPSPVPATIYVNQMLLYSGTTLKLTAPINPKTTVPITCPIFSPNGRWVVITVSVSSPSQPPATKCLVFDLSKLPPAASAK